MHPIKRLAEIIDDVERFSLFEDDKKIVVIMKDGTPKVITESGIKTIEIIHLDKKPDEVYLSVAGNPNSFNH